MMILSLDTGDEHI